MQSYFYDLADYVFELISRDQAFTAFFSAEESEFVRFNASTIREPGTVTQRYLTLDLIEDRRHLGARISLKGTMKQDRFRLRECVRELS